MVCENTYVMYLLGDDLIVLFEFCGAVQDIPY